MATKVGSVTLVSEELEKGRAIEALGAESVSALRKFLAQPEVTTTDIGRAKIAASAFSGYTRYRQTESSRESNLIMLSRELAKDKDELRQFLKLGMPNAPIMKALSSGK